ncbi:MAG: hypothetical protein ACI30K_03695 [Muribaculaceae bacterium]
MPSSISNPVARRLHHPYMLKGIAIAMVVMGLVTMCIRDIDSAAAFKIISNTHMPTIAIDAIIAAAIIAAVLLANAIISKSNLLSPANDRTCLQIITKI